MSNIITTLRRLGQQMTGWDEPLSSQHAQLPLIKKLYANHGLELIRTSLACPEQYDIMKDGQMVAYYRLRHGEFTVDYPSCGGEKIYSAQPNGDGIFDTDERLVQMTKALRCLLIKLNK